MKTKLTEKEAQKAVIEVSRKMLGLPSAKINHRYVPEVGFLAEYSSGVEGAKSLDPDLTGALLMGCVAENVNLAEQLTTKPGILGGGLNALFSFLRPPRRPS